MSTEALQLEVVALADLKPHPQNYRGHPQDQIEHLKRSIEDFGVYRNVVCAKDGTLLAGHGVVEAARQLGLEAVPVHRQDVDPDDPKAIRLLLADNLLALLAEDDDAAISGLLESIADDDETAAALLGRIREDAIPDFEDEMPPAAEDGDERISQAPEVQKKWQVELGDWWTLGRHRLWCGDSREVAGEFKGDLLLADPPYGIAAVGSSGVLSGAGYLPVAGDDEEFDPQWLLDLAPKCLLWGGNHYASRLPNSASWVVWDKGFPEGWSFGDFEVAWGNRGGPSVMIRYRWAGGARRVDSAADAGQRVHPTQKPVGLMEEILKMFGDGESWTVLDPYAGSGPVLLACERQGHTCIAGELEPMYCAVILERWSEMTGEEPKRDAE